MCHELSTNIWIFLPKILLGKTLAYQQKVLLTHLLNQGDVGKGRINHATFVIGYMPLG